MGTALAVGQSSYEASSPAEALSIASVLRVPLVAFVPLQPPDAVHEVAFVELHVSVEAAPLAMDVGFAVSVTVAAGAKRVAVSQAVCQADDPRAAAAELLQILSDAS